MLWFSESCCFYRNLDVAEDNDLGDNEDEDDGGLVSGLNCKIVVRFRTYTDFYNALKVLCGRSLNKVESFSYISFLLLFFSELLSSFICPCDIQKFAWPPDELWYKISEKWTIIGFVLILWQTFRFIYSGEKLLLIISANSCFNNL